MFNRNCVYPYNRFVSCLNTYTQQCFYCTVEQNKWAVPDSNTVTIKKFVNIEKTSCTYIENLNVNRTRFNSKAKWYL